MKYLYTLLLASALLVVNTKAADLTSTANLTAVGTTSGNAVTGNSNLVAYPCALHSLTFSGTITTGTNVTVYLYDARTNGYVATYTLTRPTTYRTNMPVSWVDIFGITRLRTNYNAIYTLTNIASTTVSKPLVSVIGLSSTTVMPITYTFDPPLIFSHGIMVTNSFAHTAGSNNFAVLYNYSPLL